jgi:hypothetical protein
MLTTNEITTLKEKMVTEKNEHGLALLLTIEQMQKESFEYKNTVLRKLNTLEADMERLVKENERHFTIRESAFVERDTCISLLIKLAVKLGFAAGVSGNNVVLELKSGQVSWDFAESEIHLLEGLPAYHKPIEEIDMVEKYSRIMNAGIV